MAVSTTMVPAGSLVGERHFLAAQIRRQAARDRLPAALPAAARPAAPACHRRRRTAAAARRWRRLVCADRTRRAQAGAVLVRIDDAGAGNAAIAAIRIDRLLLLRTGRTVAHRSPAAVRPGGHNADRRATSPDRWARGGAVRRNRLARRGHSADRREKGSGRSAPEHHGRNRPGPRPGGHNADRPATAPGRAAAARPHCPFGASSSSRASKSGSPGPRRSSVA